MYARGILFGKMKYELGDHSFVRCPELGLSADIEFKTKGYFGGTYNAIGGTIKNDNTGEVLYELSGMWSGEMIIKDLRVRDSGTTAYYGGLLTVVIQTGKKDLLFNAVNAKPTAPLVRPLEEQGERESQKLWLPTAKAVINRDHVVATDEKTKVEDQQRDEAAKRAEEGVDWQPKLFRRVRGGPGGPEEGEEDLDWILNANMWVFDYYLSPQDADTINSDGQTPQQQTEQILAVTPILKGQKPTEKNEIPPQHALRESHPPSNSTPTPQIQPPPAGDDLIDFGQTASTPVPASHFPADLKAAQTQNNGQEQKDLEHTLRSTSTERDNKESLIDFHEDLKENLPKADPILKREDTDTKSLDEFVDARE